MSADIPGSVAVSTIAPCGISIGLPPLPFPIVWRLAFHSIADDLSMEAAFVANVAGPSNISEGRTTCGLGWRDLNGKQRRIMGRQHEVCQGRCLDAKIAL